MCFMPFDEDPSENRSELDLCIDEIKSLQAENKKLKEDVEGLLKDQWYHWNIARRKVAEQIEYLTALRQSMQDTEFALKKQIGFPVIKKDN